MPKVNFTIRSREPGIPPLEIKGETLFEGCSLCVSMIYYWDYAKKEWKHRDGFQINHIPTGFNLGMLEFESRADAQVFLQFCDPHFPGWAVAKGEPADFATIACRQKFLIAEQATADA